MNDQNKTPAEPSAPALSVVAGSASSGPWLCALEKWAEHWEWGGDTKDDAINAGLDLWGGEDRPDGFWIAPAHKSDETNIDDCDPEEAEYTVENDRAEWIPLR